MSIKEFKLDTKAAGAQALDGLWGPGPPGDLLYDMSRSGAPNHATRIGTGARSQMSDRGRVMLFNGVDDAYNTEFSLGTGVSSFTLCAWVWLDSTVADNLAVIFGSGIGLLTEFMLRVSNSAGVGASLRAFGNGGGIAAAAAAGTFHGFKNSWAHVAVTRRAGRGCDVYQNGLLIATDAAAADDISTAEVLQIGCADTAATRWWQGMIDDARYYTRALSIAEVTHIYNATRWTPYADIRKQPIQRHIKGQLAGSD